MKLRWLLAALFLTATVGAAYMAARPRARVEAPYAGKPEIVAATFSSAWCAPCKILEPRLAAVIPEFQGEAVSFIDLDFTFGARPELESLAARNGIGEIYERNKGATGFTMLVDRDSGAIVETLTINHSEDAMRSAIERALKVASYTDEEEAAEARGR